MNKTWLLQLTVSDMRKEPPIQQSSGAPESLPIIEKVQQPENATMLVDAQPQDTTPTPSVVVVPLVVGSVVHEQR